MGKALEPERVKLFAGIITSLPEILADVEAGLAGICGPSDLKAGPFPFDFTHYYDRTMGAPLFRWFLGFRELIAPAALVALKIKTNDLEARAAARCAQPARPVNIDPGYLEQSKIVMASTKNYYHRILLAAGIYGEVTMHYEGGRWCSFPWTYPDFRSGRYDGFFTELRRIYRAQVRSADSS